MNSIAIQNIEAGAAKQPRPKLHEIKPREPKTTSREAAGGQGATLIVAACGALFLAYVFNFKGFETSVDGYFNGLNAAVQSHHTEVSHAYLSILPLAGVLLLAGVAWILGKTLFGVAKGIFKPKKKAKAKQQPAVAEAVPLVVAKKPVAKAPAVCVKPLRLDRIDRGVTRVILTKR